MIRIMNFDDLANKISQIIHSKQHVVVAVSGFGGSGKSTLAERLKIHFPDSTLLQLDNFLINHGEGEGWQGGYDWDRFEQALKDVWAGKDMHYQWYNWEKDETKDWIDQPLPKLVIVEGVRIFQPNFRQYFDLEVWIDRALEESTAQGKRRDRANKSSDTFDIESHIKKWDDVWTPKEIEFNALFKPSTGADILFKDDL